MANPILKIIEAKNSTEMICEGDFNVTNGESIKQALLESAARKGDEILSLAGATSIDASGIQLAFAWRTALQTQHRKADVLFPQSSDIKDLLEKTGITQIF
jgi:anti-anti-sigma regulatory factor